jgi:hypothetical protein
MNLFTILKSIFPTKPTLQEFIEAANPQATSDVEFLEKKYEEFIRSTEWSHLELK